MLALRARGGACMTGLGTFSRAKRASIRAGSVRCDRSLRASRARACRKHERISERDVDWLDCMRRHLLLLIAMLARQMGEEGVRADRMGWVWLQGAKLAVSSEMWTRLFRRRFFFRSRVFILLPSGRLLARGKMAA